MLPIVLILRYLQPLAWCIWCLVFAVWYLTSCTWCLVCGGSQGIRWLVRSLPLHQLALGNLDTTCPTMAIVLLWGHLPPLSWPKLGSRSSLLLLPLLLLGRLATTCPSYLLVWSGSSIKVRGKKCNQSKNGQCPTLRTSWLTKLCWSG